MLLNYTPSDADVFTSLLEANGPEGGDIFFFLQREGEIDAAEGGVSGGRSDMGSIQFGNLAGKSSGPTTLSMGGVTDLTNGDDTYQAGSNEVVNGLDGNDTISTGGSNSTLNGNGGDDTLRDTSFSRSNNVLNGGDGADTITVYGSGSTANGDDGNDTIFIAFAGTAANGGAGDDTIWATGDFEFSFSMAVDGGSGTDRLAVRFNDNGDSENDNRYGGTLDMSTGTATGDYSFLTSISGFESLDFTGGGESDNITGTDGGDVIRDGGYYSFFGGAGGFFPGNGNDDTLNGGAGNDSIYGTGGTDTLNGGAGDDIISSGSDREFTYDDLGETGTFTRSAQATINGGDGNDTIISRGNDTIDGGDGDDVVIMGLSERNSSTATEGGAGIDEINFSNLDPDEAGGAANSLLVVDLQGQAYSLRDTSTNAVIVTDTFSGFENVTGSEYRDVLQGDGSDNVLQGLGGDDALEGRGGNDTAVYSSSNIGDYIFRETAPGEYTVEALATDEGFDTLTGIQTVRLGGVDGTDYDISTLLTAGGTFDLTAGDDVYSGTSGDDVINALAGNDDVMGLTGNDTINGGSGNDVLDGGQGDDMLNGDEGNDTLIGGLGADILNGGAGTDTASYEGETGYLLIDLATGVTSGLASGDSFISIENITGGESRNSLRGDSAGNVLTGGQGNDTFLGRNGNDTLIGGDGNDALDGGLGMDILFGGGGDDSLDGSQGTEAEDDFAVYVSTNPMDYIVTFQGGDSYTVEAIGGTGEGVDTLTGIEFIRLGGVDGTDYDISSFPGAPATIDLTPGNDSYSGTSFDEIINGLGGNDVIDGGGGQNTLNGDDGNDTLISFGNDTLNGGAGDDLVEMGGNVFDTATLTDGGDGTDTISFSTLAQLPSGNLFLVLNLQGQAYSVRDGSTVLYVDQFSNFENAIGSAFRDLLQGDANANRLIGLAGDDNLQGRDGDDIIDGGSGADILNGGDGTDTATYASALAGVTALMGDAASNSGDAAGDSYIDIENLIGSDFDDVLGGTSGANVIDGGLGFDVASYSASSSGIVFDSFGLVAASGDIALDTLISIEAIRGTDFNDRFFGDNGESIFYGGKGADRLFGRNGDDALYGEGGNDTIIAGRDDDLLDGGDGNDLLYGNEGNDTLLGGEGNDALSGGAGADALNGGAGIDRADYAFGTNAGVTASLADSSINTGDAAGDTYVDIENLYGTSFMDTLYGDAGNNRLDGRDGDDALFGGDGRDYLIGGAGNDVLNGGGGNDLLSGQAGQDIFQFGADHGIDRILVFTQGEDRIEFTDTVSSFDDLILTQTGTGVTITSAAGTIIINNSLVSDFDTDDFIFTPPAAEVPMDDMRDLIVQDIMDMDDPLILL